MRVSVLTVLAVFISTVFCQDAYTQGVLNGATFALAGTAAVGLGVLALKEHQKNRRRYRYNPYGPYYSGYYQQPGYYQGYQQPVYHGNGYQQQIYHQPDYYNGYQRRRRDLSSQDRLEAEFSKILAQDKDQCGLRLVCELEARNRQGEKLGDYGDMILELFGPNPRAVNGRALNTAHGKYSHAAYIGSVSTSATCRQNYEACQYNSNLLLQLVKVARTAGSQ